MENVQINAVNSCLSASSLTTKMYAGAIVGYVNGGSLLYCSVSNSSVNATNSGSYGACHVGSAVGSAEKGTLTNVVCRDTSVSAYAKYESTASANDAQYPDPNNPGWAVAGGLIGVSNLTDLIRCGYTQSEGSANKITANGGTGAIAGGLLGTFKSGSIEYRVNPKLCRVTMATAPEVTSNYASVNKDCLRFGSVAGYCSCGMRTLYKYRDSYPEDLRSKFNSDRWWLDYEAVNVNTINKQAFIDFASEDYNYKKYLAFDGFEALSDGSGLMPLFRFGSGNQVFNYSLIDFPVRKTYVEGDYIDLTGLYSYQCMGLEKLSDITYPYVHVSQGAELLNAPLSAGTHTIELLTSNGGPVTFTITVLPASHIYLESFLKEPTCTEGGESIQTCLHCGAQKERKTVEKLGHDEVLIDQGYPATCTSNGKNPSYRCSRCGEEFGGGLILGFHIYSEHVDGYPATCTKDGMTEGYRCANCGKIDSGCEPIPATGKHRAVTVEGYPATCQATGLTDGEICGDCDTVLKEQTVIPVAGHQTETTTVLEPGCVSGGVQQETCTVCREIIRLKNLSALGHDYQTVVTAPTCENPGYTTHTCTRCGDSYTSPTDHHYDSGVITREPTCTEEGEMTYTCSCGDTHTEPIPTIAHNYAVTAPTCTEMGYTTHACTQCGDSYVDTYTVPNGHSWDEGITVTAPTLIRTGLLRQGCTVCDAEQETVIPALTSCNGGLDCPSRKFKDVPGSEHWAHVGIDYVLWSSFFYGVSNDEFMPDAPMTRAMPVTVMYRMEGSPSLSGLSHSFEDTHPGAWYEDALIWASHNGIVNGITTTRFDPDGNITREQAAAILYRYATLRGYDTTAATDLSSFSDSDDVAKYAKEAIAWANATGLIRGYTDGALHPRDSATRAQLAAILMRFMKNVVEQ